jgi:hypothetical protein
MAAEATLTSSKKNRSWLSMVNDSDIVDGY